MYIMMYRDYLLHMGRIGIDFTYDGDITFVGLNWSGAGMSVNATASSPYFVHSYNLYMYSLSLFQ